MISKEPRQEMLGGRYLMELAGRWWLVCLTGWQGVELWGQKAADVISRITGSRETGDDDAGCSYGRLLLWEAQHVERARWYLGGCIQQIRFAFKECLQRMSREIDVNDKLKKLVAGGIKGKCLTLMEEWGWPRQELVSKIEVKDVNTSEDGNEEKWGSWPAGNYFIWEVGGNVYCFKLYDKRIILNIPGIGNKWRERLLEEEDHWNKAVSLALEMNTFVPVGGGGRMTKRIISLTKWTSTFQGRKAGSCSDSANWTNVSPWTWVLLVPLFRKLLHLNNSKYFIKYLFFNMASQ